MKRLIKDSDLGISYSLRILLQAEGMPYIKIGPITFYNEDDIIDWLVANKSGSVPEAINQLEWYLKSHNDEYIKNAYQVLKSLGEEDSITDTE